MILTSPAFDPGGSIPSKYTCDGVNVHPPLRFEDVPREAKSIALILDDPDAPNGTFTHWTLWNFDPESQEIEEGIVPPEVVQGMTSFQKQGYGGPCPSSGEHRYVFTAYALSTLLDLMPRATVLQLQAAMSGAILAEAELTGRYERT